MMKKLMVLVLMVMMLSACGGGESSSPQVDLTGFYAGLEEEYELGGGMVDIEGEMLEGYYPGLSEIPTVQFVAKMPMMSAVVNEMVFLQCETEADAAKAVEILQERIDLQAEGGAWYPESMEAWGRGTVIQQGSYVAMIASSEYQEEIQEDFNDLFD